MSIAAFLAIWISGVYGVMVIESAEQGKKLEAAFFGFVSVSVAVLGVFLARLSELVALSH